ncbi:MAG: hypothetical protein B6D63_01195 [Candidatus Latescibacteria bacterium 4484_7]|nr:MAG: hypothetical protein B6D63_01195 [Candidatus Latescibacteria bacterium 4484_7]
MGADFTYVVARIRAIEASMPDNAWFQRLSRSGPDSLLQTLREQFAGFEAADSIGEYESGLMAERDACLELLSKIIPDERYVRFLKVGYDFDNLIIAWKAKKLGADVDLNIFGTVDPSTMEEALEHDDVKLLPEFLKELPMKLERAFESSQNAAVSVYIGEKEKWNHLLRIAPDHKTKDYLKKKIDLMNIKTLIRSKRTGLRREALELAWLEGGEIDTDRFVSAMQEGEEEFYSYLKFTSYRGLLRLGLEKGVSEWKVDVITAKMLLELLNESNYEFFSFLPVIAFVERLEYYIKLTRTIIVSIVNRLPEDLVAERVDSMLVA